MAGAGLSPGESVERDSDGESAERDSDRESEREGLLRERCRRYVI